MDIQQKTPFVNYSNYRTCITFLNKEVALIIEQKHSQYFNFFFKYYNFNYLHFAIQKLLKDK